MAEERYYLWLDAEMTGLEPEEGALLLEVAAILTTVSGERLGSLETVIHYDQEALEPALDDFARRVHSENGLLERVLDSSTSLEQAEDALIALLEDADLIVDDRGRQPRPILAGNSIHQDMRFLRKYMPRLTRRLHYRMLDVTACSMWVEDMRGDSFEIFVKGESHRALDDIEASISELIDLERQMAQ